MRNETINHAPECPVTQTCEAVEKTSQSVFSSLKALISKWKQAYHLRQQQRISRDAFDTMLGLDEWQLKDIGVTRAQVEWASKLPLHCNAGKLLRNLSEQRKKQLGS